MREALSRLRRREDLSEAQSAAVFELLMRGQANPATTAALLMALGVKGESESEILGAARVMRAASTPFPADLGPLLDTCGTGGSGRSRPNISTAVAIVCASLGLRVAKHGNRAASSRSGSADVLEALGLNLELSVEEVSRCIREVGVGFLYAKILHPAMRHAAPIRKALGVRTIFNLLGPLSHPAKAQRHCMGVYDPERCEVLARVLGALGCERALVMHGWLDAHKNAAGVDDASLWGPTRILQWYRGECTEWECSPSDAGVAEHPIDALRGGDPEHNAQLLRDLLAGRHGAYRDAVVYSGALALVTASDDGFDTLAQQADRVRHALDSGLAAKTLDALIAVSQSTPRPSSPS